MLYEKHCRALTSGFIVVDWDNNDIVNNSFDCERYSGPRNNDARHRPYLDVKSGEIQMRSPYPFSISQSLDDLILVRVVNTVLLRSEAHEGQDPRIQAAIAEGQSVASEIAKRFKSEPGRKIALLGAAETSAKAIFEGADFERVIHEDIPDSMRCLPRDPHPNKEGHTLMLKSLLETMRAPHSAPPKARD